jgi:hypothetical protein
MLREYASCIRVHPIGRGTRVSDSGSFGATFGLMSAQPMM